MDFEMKKIIFCKRTSNHYIYIYIYLCCCWALYRSNKCPISEVTITIKSSDLFSDIWVCRIMSRSPISRNVFHKETLPAYSKSRRALLNTDKANNKSPFIRPSWSPFGMNWHLTMIFLLVPVEPLSLQAFLAVPGLLLGLPSGFWKKGCWQKPGLGVKGIRLPPALKHTHWHWLHGIERLPVSWTCP